jgi:hypothetical protein
MAESVVSTDIDSSVSIDVANFPGDIALLNLQNRTFVSLAEFQPFNARLHGQAFGLKAKLDKAST